MEGIVPVRRLPNKLLEHRRVRFESVRKNREALSESEGSGRLRYRYWRLVATAIVAGIEPLKALLCKSLSIRAVSYCTLAATVSNV